MEGLRSFGIKQVCPICRVDLPPGPEQLFEEATRRYCDVQRRVDRGEASWGALTKTKQKEMDEVLRLWRSAAEQGHADAQIRLGSIYGRGLGVRQDHAEAARWFRVAAEQEQAKASADLKKLEELLAAAQHAQSSAVPKTTPTTDTGTFATIIPVSTGTVCSNCGVPDGSSGVVLRSCSRCNGAQYCGTACQSQHWKAPGGHKATCGAE